jgi:hypothetical protein
MMMFIIPIVLLVVYLTALIGLIVYNLYGL